MGIELLRITMPPGKRSHASPPHRLYTQGVHTSLAKPALILFISLTLLPPALVTSLIFFRTRTLHAGSILLIIGSFVLAGALIYLAIDHMLRPIRQLNRTAAKFSKGEWSERANTHRNDESGLLAESFNTMASELSSLYASLEAAVRNNSILANLTSEIAALSSVPINETVRSLAALIAGQFDFYSVAIYLMDETGRNLGIRAAYGESSERLMQRESQIDMNQASLVSWAARYNQLKMATIDSPDGLFRSDELLPGSKAQLAIPLALGQDVMGILLIHTARVDELDKGTLTVLQSIAALISSRLYISRQYETSQINSHESSSLFHAARQAAQARIPALQILNNFSQKISAETDLNQLFRVLHHQVIQMFGSDLEFAIALYRHQDNQIRFPYFYEQGKMMNVPPISLGEGLTSILIESRKPLLLPDENAVLSHTGKVIGRKPKSWMGIPLVYANAVVGAVLIQDLEQENRFSEDDVNLFNTLAPQIAIAVRNADLFSETQDLLSKHRLLRQVSIDASNSTNLDDALTNVVQGLHSGNAAEKITIFLLNQKGVLEVGVSAGYHDVEDLKQLMNSSQDIFSQAATEKHSIRIDDIQAQARASSIQPGIHSNMAVPILFGDEFLGILNLESAQVAAFTENDQEIFSALGNNLGGVIANLRLANRIRQQVRREQQLFEITSKIRQSVDLETILETTAQESCRATGARRARVHMAAGNFRSKQAQNLPFHNDAVKVYGDLAHEHERQPREENQTENTLQIPLALRGEVIGEISLDIGQVGFSSEDQAFLENILTQAAFALENAWLLQETRRKAQHERILNQISARLMKSIRIEDILHAAAQELGLLQAVSGVSIHLNSGQLAPVTVPAIKRTGMVPQAALSVPIRLRNQDLGEVNIQFEGNDIPQDTTELVQEVVGRLAISLENARLLAEIQSRAEREQKALQITARIRSTNDPQEMIAIAVQDLQRSLGATRAQLYIRRSSQPATAQILHHEISSGPVEA